MTVNSPETPVDEGPLVHWPAVFRGALLGLCVLVGGERDRGDPRPQHRLASTTAGGSTRCSSRILFGYTLGGWQAGRMAPDAVLTNGALAGVGAFVLWIPVRIVIWVVRDENRGLFSGHSPALRPGQIFGHLVIAAALGMLGGFSDRRIALAAAHAVVAATCTRRRRLVGGSESAGWPWTGMTESEERPDSTGHGAG